MSVRDCICENVYDKVPISLQTLRFYMKVGSDLSNLYSKKLRSEAFLYFFHAVELRIPKS